MRLTSVALCVLQTGRPCGWAPCRAEEEAWKVWTWAVCENNLNAMRPLDIQQIGNELAVKWSGGGESFILLETLRRACPCAGCKGETDIMGNVYKNPEQKLSTAAFQLKHFISVGGYAIQPVWADGHATGIYSFEYLKRVADEK